jgi:hypothetical protein
VGVLDTIGPAKHVRSRSFTGLQRSPHAPSAPVHGGSRDRRSRPRRRGRTRGFQRRLEAEYRTQRLRRDAAAHERDPEGHARGAVAQILSQQSGTFGDVTADFAFTTDGKECENKVMDMVIKSTVKWDGSVLVIDSTMDIQGSPMTLTDRWTLSPDGKELTIDRHATGPMGSGGGKMIFEKQ